MECRLCLRGLSPITAVDIFGQTEPLARRIWSCCQLQVLRQYFNTSIRQYRLHIDITSTCSRFQSFQVEKGDGLPDRICSSCESNLELITNFKKISSQSDEILRRKLTGDLNIKVEAILLDEIEWTHANFNLKSLPFNSFNDSDKNVNQPNVVDQSDLKQIVKMEYGNHHSSVEEKKASLHGLAMFRDSIQNNTTDNSSLVKTLFYSKNT